MRDDLWQALTAGRDDPEVGAMVVRGEGRAWCAGDDLAEFGTAPAQAQARGMRRDDSEGWTARRGRATMTRRPGRRSVAGERSTP